MIRRAFRVVVAGVCLLSLVACVAAGWMWWRSDSGMSDHVSVCWRDDRYTLRSSGGRLRVTVALPGGSGAPLPAFAPHVRNDDLEWNVINDARAHRPEPDPPTVVASYRRALLEDVRLDELPDVMRELEDPSRFVVAHAQLAATFAAGPVPCTFGPERDGWLPVTYDGLRMDLDAGERNQYGYHCRRARTDPSQASDIRDVWHRRLDTEIRAASWAWPVSLFALPPLLWLGTAGRRRLIVRRRGQQGRCVVCGYDLRASTGRCPECGSALKPVREAA